MYPDQSTIGEERLEVIIRYRPMPTELPRKAWPSMQLMCTVREKNVKLYMRKTQQDDDNMTDSRKAHYASDFLFFFFFASPFTASPSSVDVAAAAAFSAFRAFFLALRSSSVSGR